MLYIKNNNIDFIVFIFIKNKIGNGFVFFLIYINEIEWTRCLSKFNENIDKKYICIIELNIFEFVLNINFRKRCIRIILWY